MNLTVTAKNFDECMHRVMMHEAAFCLSTYARTTYITAETISNWSTAGYHFLWLVPGGFRMMEGRTGKKSVFILEGYLKLALKAKKAA